MSAPPARFVVSVPKAWIKPSQARISWEPAASADGPLSYALVLDGRRLAAPAGSFALAIDPRRLSTGVHAVQLLATDAYGQETLTAPSRLRIDGQAPTVKITRTGGGTGTSTGIMLRR